MEQKFATAQLKYLRIAPRKTRLAANVIKNLSINEAEARLLSLAKRAGIPILKLLRSAVANAKNTMKLDPGTMYVKEIRVDQGPKLRRWTPRARGGGARIEKKTSHVSLVIAVREGVSIAEGKAGERFVIHGKKEKKLTEDAKHMKKGEKHAHEHAEPEAKSASEKPVEKKGFLPKVFRRKAV
ncbi:MAG: 50S ribosomal protein L22 [Candidatus Jorgensenbacteria bacterium]|nr:50S ribosomal protein L22 [Candidatus Jorgensenbacteria bacterium]